jgi:DNA-binding GntR family transcriptional regulator
MYSERRVTELDLHYADDPDQTRGDALSPDGESLHGEVLSRLRDSIVEGRIAPGARVPERELCTEFGVSRTPLREALKVLAAEGLIELFPNRGARVRQFTAKDVREFFELLAGMESAAGRLACNRISNAEIAAIERLHYDMYGHYMRRELPSYFHCNQAIHVGIVNAAGNEALKSSYQALTARMRQFRYSANTIARDRWGEAMREHEEILDALRRRDASALASILFDHLMRKHAAASQQFRAAKPS